VKRRRHSDAIDRAMEQSLRLGEFIDYNESWSFITELEEVAELIDQLLPEEAERAVALYETFIAGCYEKAAEIDDSSGNLLVDVLKDTERWQIFAVKVKQDNLKRPAFQEEFAKVVPDWRRL